MSDLESSESPKQHLEKMLSIMEITGSVVEEALDESTLVYRIECNDDDAKLLIGRKGQTLEALQFLLRQMCKSGQAGEEEHFVVDVLDYRQRRKEAIIDRAKQGAVAVLNGEYEDFALPAMTAFERRIVHNYLHENFPELASQSNGQGPDRHIVISFAGLPDGEESEAAQAEEPA